MQAWFQSPPYLIEWQNIHAALPSFLFYFILSIHYFETLRNKAELIIHYDYFNYQPFEKLPKPTPLPDKWMLYMTEPAAIHLQEKPSVYQGHGCFIFSLGRTRPCRMLNNFHVCSCLPRLIMELSPSNVEPTPSSYSALCLCAPSWSYLKMALCRCTLPESLQTNKRWGEKAKQGTIWIEGQTNA